MKLIITENIETNIRNACRKINNYFKYNEIDFDTANITPQTYDFLIRNTYYGGQLNINAIIDEYNNTFDDTYDVRNCLYDILCNIVGDDGEILNYL